MARPAVRAGQRPAASLAVDLQHAAIERLDQWLDLRVAQLADIDVAAFEAGQPAEKDVRRRLHQALAHHHPLAGVAIEALAGIGLEHRCERPA